MSTLRDPIDALLLQEPGLTAKQLAKALRRSGHDVRRKDVNQVLYNGDRYLATGDHKPTWRLLAQPAAGSPAVVTTGRQSPRPDPAQTTTARTADTGVRVASMSTPGALAVPLRPWQHAALQAWSTNDHTGVVQAVTGTGKTLVGLAAVAAEVAVGGSAVVVVPSAELLRQWREQLTRHLPGVGVGLLGDGHRVSGCEDVVVAIVNTAMTDAVDRQLAGRSLLVADECHRYGAPSFAAALRRRHPRRLGLTATLERADDGVDDVLMPYFHDVVFDYGYAQAKADGGVIAPFSVFQLGVRLQRSEQELYDEADTTLRRARTVLARHAGPDLTMEDIAVLAKSDQWRDPAVLAAKRFLKARRERADVVGSSRAKTDALDALGPALQGSRTICFGDTKHGSELVAARLQATGLQTAAMHSGHDRRQRADTLAAFGDGRLDVLCAPRVLDEGVDVPAADVALVLSASRSKRQMVQRMGRILRIKPDGRAATFVIVHALDTFEDPAVSGRHEAFLEVVTEVAEDIQTVRGTDGAVAQLVDVLTRARPQPTLTVAVPADVVGRHRADGSRPSFSERFGLVLGRRRHSHRAPAPVAAAATIPVRDRLHTPSYGHAEMCGSCSSPVDLSGLCRCS